MPARGVTLNNAISRPAHAWVTGPAAVFVSFPPARNSAAGALRPDADAITLTTAPADPFGVTLTTSFSGQAMLNTGAATPDYTTAFLGFTERAPAIKANPTYKGWHTDAGGPGHAADYWYTAAEAYVSGTFTVWNEDTYAVLAAYAGTNFRGQDLPGDVGRWMVAEGGAVRLMVVFGYAKKLAFSQAMPQGYRMLAAWLQEDASYNGSTARKLSLTWRCVRALSPANGTWNLYDHDLRDLQQAVGVYVV